MWSLLVCLPLELPAARRCRWCLADVGAEVDVEYAAVGVEYAAASDVAVPADASAEVAEEAVPVEAVIVILSVAVVVAEPEIAAYVER